jgi:hypothetical protein
MLWSQRYRSCGRELRKTRRHSADCGCKSLKTSLYFSRLCEFHQITASCTILVNNAISASPPCNLTCQEKPGVAYSAGKSDTPCLGIAGGTLRDWHWGLRRLSLLFRFATEINSRRVSLPGATPLVINWLSKLPACRALDKRWDHQGPTAGCRFFDGCTSRDSVEAGARRPTLLNFLIVESKLAGRRRLP